jgi:hypothetical protein
MKTWGVLDTSPLSGVNEIRGRRQDRWFASRRMGSPNAWRATSCAADNEDADSSSVSDAKKPAKILNA